MAQWQQKHTWLVIGGIIVIVLLVVLGASRGGNGKAVAKAFVNLAQADSFSTKAELTINLPERLRGRERPFTKTTVRLEGDVKRAEDRTPEFTGTMYFDARGRGNVFFADGQGRILRDQVLFNLDNLPVFLNPSGSLVKRWTKVEVPLMQTQNGDQVREALLRVMAKATPAGKEAVPFDGAQGKGEQLARFSITLTEEEEKALADVLRQSVSGSRALDVLARLLDANVVKELLVWVGNGQMRQVRAHFVRPLSGGREFDFARFTLRFTDYGKDVAVDAPEPKLTVRPEVFAKLFGGQQAVEEVKVESEERSE